MTRACAHRTIGNGFKMKVGTLRLDIRKKFFSAKMVKQPGLGKAVPPMAGRLDKRSSRLLAIQAIL